MKCTDELLHCLHRLPTDQNLTPFFSSQGRSHLNHEKEVFAQDHPSVNTLEEVVQKVKPTAIIGGVPLA